MSREKSGVLAKALGLASVAGAAALGYFLAKKADEYIKIQRDNEFVDDPDPFDDLDEDLDDYADDPNEETIFSITLTKSKAPEAEEESAPAEDAAEEPAPEDAAAPEEPEVEISIDITDECPEEADIPASEANEE